MQKEIHTCAQIIGCVSKGSANDFKCFSEDNFELSAKPCHYKRSQRVILLVLLERKALIRPLMIKKILCQLELRDWLSYRGQQKTPANYHVKCDGRFLCSFFTYPWIFNTGNFPRESLVTHTNTISRGKRVIYQGKSVPCNRT